MTRRSDTGSAPGGGSTVDGVVMYAYSALGIEPPGWLWMWNQVVGFALCIGERTRSCVSICVDRPC